MRPHIAPADLDSCASAIAYSYLTKKRPTIGLIQTPRADLRLRAENIAAFEAAKLSLSDLLCIDDIGAEPSQLASSFALVDHNALLPQWEHEGAEVVGIIDHHEDEGKHTTASPRNVTTPIGSCASLVAETFKDSFAPDDKGFTPPQELATLLLSAIYIDTGGLKPAPKGKAEPIDLAATTFLEQYSGHSSLSDGPEGPPYRKATADDLSEKKHSVAHLSSRDLLRRDYKEYAFTTSDGVPLTVGLSTVPLGTKVWLKKEEESTPGYRETLEAWAKERKLDVVGVLNSFHSANKGHKRRELLILVGGAVIQSASAASTNVKENVATLAAALVKGLEGHETLELEGEKLKGDFGDIKGPPGKHVHAEEVVGVVHFWRQNNTDATRKIIAPAFKSIIENLSGVKSTFALEVDGI